MADTTIYVRDSITGLTLPLFLNDNGDGTYSLGSGTGDASEASVLNTLSAINDVGTEVSEIEGHLHNYDNVYGYAAVPTGTHFGDRETLTPYQPVSGNNAFGTALGLLGTGDTPYRAGKTYFDIRKMIITSTSNATPTIVRIIWGTGAQSAAQAVTAGQYTDTAVIRLTGAGNIAPHDLSNVRVAAGNQCWIQIKNATNSATIDVFIIMHEYPSDSP